MPLSDSRDCCHWPLFRYHLRNESPSVMEWWKAYKEAEQSKNKKGRSKSTEKPPHIKDFDQFDHWQMFLGGFNKNKRGRPSKEMSTEEIEDAILAVETLDKEYLRYRVEQAREARRH